MKITHRVTVPQPASALLTPEYEAEVERSTRRAERAYAKAIRDLDRAEERLRRAKSTSDVRATRLATAIFELRRKELEELEAMMHAAPASAAHRGRRGYRPMPPTRGSLI